MPTVKKAVPEQVRRSVTCQSLSRLPPGKTSRESASTADPVRMVKATMYTTTCGAYHMLCKAGTSSRDSNRPWNR